MKTKGQLFIPKIITVLIDFGYKMEATLVEMRKLVSIPQPEPIRLPIPSPRGSPQKTRLIVELKTPLPQCPSKELVTETLKIMIPAASIPAKAKMTKKESETPKTTSFDPSPRRMNTMKN